MTTPHLLSPLNSYFLCRKQILETLKEGQTNEEKEEEDMVPATEEKVRKVNFRIMQRKRNIGFRRIFTLAFDRLGKC